MCGRYANTKVTTDLATLFEAIDEGDDQWAGSFNIAPTTHAPIVRMSKSAGGRAGVPNDQGARVIDSARWGLVPAWAKDVSIGNRMFNARSETVQTSKAYRRPFAARRALVPADGWYEWQKLPSGAKQPYFMTHRDGLTFAGLWESWGRGTEGFRSFTVLTCPAIGGLEDIHDRMPLLLPPDTHAAWLGEEDANVADLLAGPQLEDVLSLDLRKVSKAVGNVRNNGPELIDEIETVAEDDPPTLPGL